MEKDLEQGPDHEGKGGSRRPAGAGARGDPAARQVDDERRAVGRSEPRPAWGGK